MGGNVPRRVEQEIGEHASSRPEERGCVGSAAPPDHVLPGDAGQAREARVPGEDDAPGVECIGREGQVLDRRDDATEYLLPDRHATNKLPLPITSLPLATEGAGTRLRRQAGCRCSTGIGLPVRAGKPATYRAAAPIISGVKGRREAGAIRLGRDGLQLYEQSGYGRPGGDGLSLVPVEALYLVHRGRLELPGETFESLLAEFSADPHFLRSYLVYRDLRERGYVVQTGPHDFRVFRRGQRPGSGQSQYMVRVLSERDPIEFDRLIAEATSTAQMRKSHLLAVVDDEDELTYYEVKLPTLPQRESAVPERAVTAHPYGWAVIADGEEGAVLEAAGYGTRLDDRRLKLAPVEALHLI